MKLLALLSLAVLAGASAQTVCTERSHADVTICTDHRGVPDCTGGPDDRIFYVDNDLCQTEGCTFSFWIYEETNGYEGLQRKDAVNESETRWTKDDTCDGAIPSDTIVL